MKIEERIIYNIGIEHLNDIKESKHLINGKGLVRSIRHCYYMGCFQLNKNIEFYLNILCENRY